MLANIIRNAQKSFSGDPYYSAVSLLLHMDGTNASTSFVDSGPNALAVTAYSPAAISTTQSKFGGASAVFDGSSSYLTIPSSTHNLSGDFTIETWFYTLSSSQQTIVGKWNGAGNVAWVINIFPSSSLIRFGTGNSGSFITTFDVAATIATNTWHHLAITRSGTTIKIFLNGVQCGSNITSSSNLTAPDTTVTRIGQVETSSYFNGYIDDLRITKYARYTSAFAPPTQAHPNIYNPYTTLPVSGAALWLDASQQNTLFTDAGTTPVTSSGQSIYQWNDLSGNNRHAIQATSGNRPTWTPPASGQNGLGAVAFNGSTSYLTIADAAGLQFGTGDFTLFFAGVNSNVSRGGAYANIFISKGYTNIEFYQYQGLIQGYIGGTSNSPTTAASSVSNNTPYVAQMIRSGSATYVAINNTAGSSVTNTSNASGVGTAINIGTRNPLNTTLTYLGNMYEILAFGRALSSSESSSVYNYLKAKWGTP